jgi:rsbT co-antagonist protein RsbR
MVRASGRVPSGCQSPPVFAKCGYTPIVSEAHDRQDGWSCQDAPGARLAQKEEYAAVTSDTDTQQPSQTEVLELQRRIAELEQEVALYRQSAPETLRQQLTAIESALDGIAILDENGIYTYMNRAHALVHGYDDPAELIGQSWTVVVPENELDRYQSEYMPLLWRDGRWRGEGISKRRDGSLHMTDTSLTLTDTGGLVCVVRDLTDRKRTDDELQRSQALSRMVMDNIPQAIFWKDHNLDYLGCNERFARDAGLSSPAEIIGKNDDDMPWAELAELYRADDRQVMERDAPKLNFEEPIQTVDGEGWLRTSKIPLHDGEGNVVAVLGMYEDITAQKQAEAERARWQEEIIRTQAAALAELSTPLIPITDSVMVMPLIGTVDSRRAQQVIDSLLEGVASSRAQTAILDITGVPVVDTQVANALVRAAQSVKLLGAQVVLSGIRPEVAQTLVGLGVDLSGIVTSSTLQSGIAHAIAKR